MKKLLIALLLIPQLAFADRSFYSAFSLAPGATAQGDLIFPASTQGIVIGASTFNNAAEQIRLYNGNSGAIKPTNIQLEIESTANGGVNISNAAAAISGYYFSNPTASYDGGLEYANTSRTLTQRVAGNARWATDSSGNYTQDATNGGNIVQSKAFSSHLISQGLTAIPADISVSWYAPIYSFSSGTVPTMVEAYGAANTSGPNHHFMKSRNTNGSADTIVASGDTIGTIGFYGADGASFRAAAEIAAIVDTNPGASDMPGGLVFRTTPDGSITPANALYISNNLISTFYGNIAATQQITSSRTTDLGWSAVNVANQACNTTCTSACVFGMNTGALGNFVGCADATADTCICAGAS